MFKRRIGFEFEYPVTGRNGLGISRRDAGDLWNRLTTEMADWDPVLQRESGAVIGLARRHGEYSEHISNDTGVCTIEFALKPELSVFQAVRQGCEAIGIASAVAAELGFSLLCLGLQPKTWADPGRKTDKDAYQLLKMRMPYHAWSVPMASHQCSIDVVPSAAISVVNTLNAFSGLIIALTASSPLAKGVLQEWDEYRTWISDERSRRLRASNRHYYSNGLPPLPFQNWNHYIDWFWASGTYLVSDPDKRASLVMGRWPFSQFLSSTKPVEVRSPGRQARYLEPAVEHINEIHGYGWLASRLRYTIGSATTMDEIRSALRRKEIGELLSSRTERCYVEFRASGVSQQGAEGSVGALVLGLVDQHEAAEELRLSRSWAEWKESRVEGSVRGIHYLTPGSANHRLATRMIEVARSGLARRGLGEEQLLEPLVRRLESGDGYSDEIRRWFHAGGIRRVVEESAWKPGLGLAPQSSRRQEEPS
jgi:gamma-glutamylcysteine synthetase